MAPRDDVWWCRLKESGCGAVD